MSAMDATSAPAAAAAAAAPPPAAAVADLCAQRRAHLSALSADELVELLLEREFTQDRATAESNVARNNASSIAGKKHAHSPSPLDGQPAAKQSRRERKLEKRNDAKAHAEAMVHAPSSAAAAASAAAANAAASSSPAAAASPADSSPDAPNVTLAEPAAAGASDEAAPAAGKDAKKQKRTGDIDWSAVQRRHVAMKIMYIGTEFAGFAIQPTLQANTTIEGEIIRAVLLTKLAPERDAARLTRCGRTDKGVHACGQVVSMRLRSRLTDPAQLGAFPRDFEWREELAAWHSKKQEFMDEVQPAAGDTTLYDAQGYLAPAAVKDSMCMRCGVPGVGFATDADCTRHEQELDYCRMLNAVLPPAIRVVAWQPVSAEFNARFSCSARSYRYFFPADELDLGAMQTAADLLVGSHDFRNFCKQDPTMSSHFIRYLTSIEVRRCEQLPEDSVQLTAPWPCDAQQWIEDSKNSWGGREVNGGGAANAASASSSAAAASSSAAPVPSAAVLSRPHPDTMCELLIHGNAFLYHQVRCMAAVLFLVGRGVEKPALVSRLLDVLSTPNKPQYDMAPEQPLVLYDTFFPALPLTPGFDYQTRPATKPSEQLSFVGLAALVQRKGEQQLLEHGAQPPLPNAASGDVNMTDAAAVAPAAPVVHITEEAAAVSSSSASSPDAAAAAATASSPTAPPALLNLYPSASVCLRNHELVFAHFHALWRTLNMQAKVHELFVNQCARNLQAVRNQTAKLDLAHLQQPILPNGKRIKPHQAAAYVPPPVPRQYAPLLAATAGCRGHGLRPMPFLAPNPHTPLLSRPAETSFDDKIKGLRGKKLARHENVRQMASKFKKDGSYAPQLSKMEPSP